MSFGNEINYAAPFANDLVIISDSGGTIQIDWSSVSGASSYNIYIDGFYDSNQVGVSYVNSTLTSKFNYTIGVQAVFGGYNSRISNITVDLL